MMKRLLLLLSVIGFYASTSYAAAPAGQWWYTNFDNRYVINIPAGASTLPTNYSIPIAFNHAALVTAGDSLASGNDVRVVWWNGTAWVELDRILDPDSSWNSATTTIWFRTQGAIATGVTNDNYYIYYGDATAGTPPQAWANVFSFYDDFSSASVDTATRWTNNGASQAGGVLNVDNGEQIRGQITVGVNTIWETQARLSSAVAPSGTFFYFGANSSNNYNWNSPYLRFSSTTAATHTATDILAGTTTQSFAATSPTAYQNYSITREGNTVARFLVNGTQVASFTHASSTTAMRVLLTNATAAGQTQQYDWVRVRVYRLIEPTASLGAVEPLPMPAVVGEWRFEQSSWTGAANEVLDSSGNGLHMTAYNLPSTANATPAQSGDPGTCRYGVFNGTDEYVQITDNALLDQPNQVTVTTWVYPRTRGPDLRSVWSKDENYEMHVNAAGQVYWWWGGGAQELTTTGTPVPLNQWTHIAVTYQSGVQRIYINGVLRATGTEVGALTTNTDPFQIGQDQGYAGRFWDGFIDETRVYSAALSQAQVTAVMNSTRPCTTVHHFDITHDGFGITCAAVENVTVVVHDSTHSPVTSYNQQVTLDTQTGRGTWTLVSGSGTFSDATANDGLATYVWAAGQSTATFALDYRSATPPGVVPAGTLAMDVDVYQTSNTLLRDDDTEGTMNFHPSGFVVTSSLLSNPPPNPIPSFASQIAATNFTGYITAFGQTPTDTQCGVIEGYAGSKNINFWSTYVNPATGTRIATVNASNIATTEGASAAQAVTFTAGQAQVTMNYTDAGSINISLKDVTTGNPGLPTGIRGATGNFVVKPANFVLTNIRRTSDSFANPAAANATGTAFIAAGQSFSVTVEARNSAGGTTPNFGRETTPESVALTPALVLPAGGQNPVVAAPVGFGTFTNGLATGTDFSWSEVGIITLTPHIRDSDYLGAGDVTGTTSGNVGRFIPASLATTANVPQFQTGCSGGFTYIGQPFNYSTAPVLTVTARALGGTTTRNYTGAFFKLTNTSITGRTYSAVTGTLVTTGLPATTSDPTIVDLTNGVGSLTFSSGTGLSFSRTTPIAPFNAQISLSTNVIDSDSVTAANPVTFSNIAFSSSSEQRYGRIAFRNGVGSELLNLPVTMRSEYFASAASGFVVSTADSCTTGVTATLTNYGGNLASGETCLIDSGSPGTSGVGCSVAGIVGQRFSSPPTAGDFIAILRAPGAGNDGTVTISTVVPTWLRFNWNNAVAGDENPSGIATFGLFKGEAKRIYQTEK